MMNNCNHTNGAQTVEGSTPKFIIVTGGVVSGLGKGIIISSIGKLLQSCGLRLTSIKIDPYLNTDAGTMSPFEHGKCQYIDESLVFGSLCPSPVTMFLDTHIFTFPVLFHCEGEVFVLDDGGEADLDLGNYERFLGVRLERHHNITTGKVCCCFWYCSKAAIVME